MVQREDPLALVGFQSVNGTDTPSLMAASMLITLPCLPIFFVAQRQMTNGIPSPAAADASG